MYTRRLLSGITVVSLLALHAVTGCGSKDKKLKEQSAAEGGGAGGESPASGDVAAEGGESTAPAAEGGAGGLDGAGAVGGMVIFSSGGAPPAVAGRGSVGFAGTSASAAGSAAGGAVAGGGTTSTAMPDLVVSATQQPGKLQTSGAFTYFSDVAGRVRRLPAGGKTIEEVGMVALPQNATEPPAFAVHGDSVFVATSPAANMYGIATLPVTGGTATPWVTTPVLPTAIVADDENVYYASQTSTLMRVAIATKMQTSLADASLVTALALDATNVYFLGSNGLRKVPIAGGTNTPLATDVRQATTLLLDAENAYFGVAQVPQGGSLMKVPLSGAGQPVSIATLTGRPRAIAGNATDAYLALPDGTIVKVPLDGSAAPVTLMTNQISPTSISLDASRVYWTVQSGEVRSVLLE